MWVQLLLRCKGNIEGHDNLLVLGLNTPQVCEADGQMLSNRRCQHGSGQPTTWEKKSACFSHFLLKCVRQVLFLTFAVQDETEKCHVFYVIVGWVENPLGVIHKSVPPRHGSHPSISCRIDPPGNTRCSPRSTTGCRQPSML